MIGMRQPTVVLDGHSIAATIDKIRVGPADEAIGSVVVRFVMLAMSRRSVGACFK